MNRFEYLDGGKKFRLTIDTFDGAALPDGLEFAPDYYLADRSKAAYLSNMLCDQDGVIRKRGGMMDADGSAINAGEISTVHSTSEFTNPFSSVTVGPYLGTTVPSAGTRPSGYLKASSAGGTSIGVGAHPVTKIPYVDGKFVWCGQDYSSSTDTSRPDYVRLVCPNVSSYSTGSVTMTANGTSVTGAGTTWTAAMVGALFSVSDSIGYRRAYTIKSINTTAQTLVLSEPYKGDQLTAGRPYTISQQELLYGGQKTTSAWGNNAASYAHARVACEHGQRLWLGFTREPESNTADPAAGTSLIKPSRLRWSGIIGSQEGFDSTATVSATNNEASSGIRAWSANGFVDLNTRFGSIVAMKSYGGALVVWQESGMTVIHGSPTFSGAGSLDVTTTYPGISIKDGFSFDENDDGLFFVDSKKGMMVYRPGASPRAIPQPQAFRHAVQTRLNEMVVCAYGEYILVATRTQTILATYGSPSGILLIHTPTMRWSSITSTTLSDYTIAGIVPTGLGYPCVVLSKAGSTKGYSLEYLITGNSSESDDDGGFIECSYASLMYGEYGVRVRPEAVYTTMRVKGIGSDGPSIFLVMGGAPGTGSTPYDLLTSSETADAGQRVQTFTWHPQVEECDTFGVEIRDSTSDRSSRLDIIQIVVEGTVEGRVSAA